jgi:hypothetical protein
MAMDVFPTAPSPSSTICRDTTKQQVKHVQNGQRSRRKKGRGGGKEGKRTARKDERKVVGGGRGEGEGTLNWCCSTSVSESSSYSWASPGLFSMVPEGVRVGDESNSHSREYCGLPHICTHKKWSPFYIGCHFEHKAQFHALLLSPPRAQRPSPVTAECP